MARSARPPENPLAPRRGRLLSAEGPTLAQKLCQRRIWGLETFRVQIVHEAQEASKATFLGTNKNGFMEEGLASIIQPISGMKLSLWSLTLGGRRGSPQETPVTLHVNGESFVSEPWLAVQESRREETFDSRVRTQPMVLPIRSGTRHVGPRWKGGSAGFRRQPRPPHPAMAPDTKFSGVPSLRPHGPKHPQEKFS